MVEDRRVSEEPVMPAASARASETVALLRESAVVARPLEPEPVEWSVPRV